MDDARFAETRLKLDKLLAADEASEVGLTTEDYEEVVRNTPVPIVIAGGKKIPEPEAIELAHSAVQAGASGVDMGRTIFQSDCPVGMIRAVRAVVHEDATVDDAYAIYDAEKQRAGSGLLHE